MCELLCVACQRFGCDESTTIEATTSVSTPNARAKRPFCELRVPRATLKDRAVLHLMSTYRGSVVPRPLVSDKRSELAHRESRFGITARRCATEVRCDTRSTRQFVSEIIDDVDCCSVHSDLTEQILTARFVVF